MSTKLNEPDSVSLSIILRGRLSKTNIIILEEAHDIVFAANVLQTTTNVVASIIALRQLLAPGGLLLLVELTLTHPYFDLLYGIFSYWWRDGDANRALLKIDQWIHTINSAGGFESVVASSSPNLFGDTVIIAQKTTARSVLTNLPEWQNQAWILLADRTQNLAGALATHLPSPNIVFIQDTTSKDTIHSTIERMLLQYRQLHIVFAWPLDTRPLGNSNNETIFNWQEEHLCSTVLCILQTVENHCQKECLYPYLYVLTHNAQPIANSCTLDLGAAPLIGLTRSLSVECVRHHVKLLDLQSAKDLLTDQAFISVVAQYLIDSRSFDDFDECVLYQDENDLIKRFQWCYEVTQHNDQNEQLMVIENQIVPQRDADDNPFRLEIAPSRFLADLAWVRELPLLGRLLPDQLHVRVHCVGLNFRDVLKTRGLYPHTREFAQLDKDQPLMDRDESFGVDFTGTVIRSASTRFKIGDRVSGFCLSGVFHSHVIVDTNEVVRVPEDCLASDEQLATLSTGFLTAIFSLKHRVHLSPNKIVLIHAATGATGQACIQYCLAVGARVIATAGSDEKRRFLREHYGIEHVFNSRDLSFVSCISALFPCGVDVIINSLSGPLLNESVKLLASHGQFVELGKRDVFANGHVSMFALRRDCSFHVIDLSLVAFNQPHMISEMLADMMDCIRRGLFKPIEPMTVCEPSEVIDAFTQCGIGKGMGKTIIRMANSEKTLALKACKKDAETSESRQEGRLILVS